MQPLAPQPLTAPPAPFPVVGLGASAGGLAALQQFLTAMPTHSGMAFVIILHLSPDHESHAAQILQRSTPMPVRQVTQPMRVAPECVYLIPPDRQLRMDDGMIFLAPRERVDGRPVAIDLFFRTLAESHTTRAACIVLSGTGADGSVGITRVKERGGFAIAQDPQEAAYDSMPRNAIATGMIDHVLPVAAMPACLLATWRNAEQLTLPEGAGTAVVDEHLAAEKALYDLLATVRRQTGHDFTHYKRQTMLRRVERRMQVTSTTDLLAYRDYVQANPAEAALLLQDLLISVTNFFRDGAAFEALAREAIPLLFAGKGAGDAVRVWVPGCASGEEAYSLVILLLEHAAARPDPPAIQVFATDIDEAALRVAREGSYSEAIAADVSPARLRQFFTQEPGSYRVTAAVRDRVVFAAHNLVTDPPFSRLDLISCRNLLIYLTPEAQAHVFRLFHFALRPGGCLFLGSVEAPLAASDSFAPLDRQQRIYRAVAAAPPLDMLPAAMLQTPAGWRPARLAGLAERARIAFSDLHQRMLERHTPPSIVVNAAHEIVHLSENAGRFVQLADGALSFSLPDLVRPELRVELTTALGAALQSRQPAQSALVPLEQGGEVVTVTMRVFPEREPPSGAWFALVFFDVFPASTGAAEPPGGAGADRPGTPQLAAELRRLQAGLAQAVSEHSATVEELSTANEELLTSNEELRATTEELEASQEELQSVNEELRTVNDELNHRVDELSEANADLSILMAATAIATLFLDRDLRLIRFTPPATGLFSLLHQDEGRPLAHITHSLDYPDLLADVATVLHASHPIEREVGSANGQHYLARIAPYHTGSDRTHGVVVTFVNISERKQAEEALARAYAAEQAARIAAEAALQTRDQFLSIASHELRTPMTALLGYAQLLQKALRRGTGDLAKMVDRVIRQTKRLDDLVDQLLDVSRLQRGQFVIERTPLNLAALGAEVVAEFRDTLPREVAHTLTLAQADGPVHVAGDPARLEQVLLNLLSNAVKYSRPGAPVQVQIRQTADEAVLEVVDQGIGIPREVQDRLFVPFFRAPNVGVQASGFGLGLYIVREIVRRHDGRIEVESAEGAGSTFRVRLPRVDPCAPHTPLATAGA